MRSIVPHGLLLLLAFAVVAAPAPVAHADPDGAASRSGRFGGAALNQRRLANGLTVIVQEDHRTPLVSLVLRYDVGERAAPDGKHGIAWLTRILASNASKHVPPGDALRLLIRAGSSPSEDTDTDVSLLSATLPAYRLALPLWLWSDQMGFFSQPLDEAAFRSKRDELVARRRAGLESYTLSRLDGFADEEVFPPGHPYHEELGTPESVARITAADVVAFHDRWMTPDHATLVVVGDVGTTEAFAEVERYFGPIPPSTAGSSIPSLPVPKLVGETRVEVEAQVPNARVSIRWPTPRYMSAEDAHLDIVAALLGGTHRAFLYWELVSDQKVAVSVSTRQRSRHLASEFVISIEGAPGKSAAELLTAFDAAMDKLKATPFDQADIDHAAYDAIVGPLYALEGNGARAWAYASYKALTGTAGYAEADRARYEHVTPPVIASTLTRFLPRDRRVVLLVTPARNAAPGGERKSRRVIPARQP